MHPAMHDANIRTCAGRLGTTHPATYIFYYGCHCIIRTYMCHDVHSSVGSTISDTAAAHAAAEFNNYISTSAYYNIKWPKME